MTALRLHRAAAILVVAAVCLLLFPPPVLAGVMTQLEIALAAFGASAALVLTSPRPVRTFVVPLPLAALLLFMAATVLWSITRTQTIHDIAIVAVLSAAAIMLVACARLSDLALGLVVAGLLVVGWSLVALAVGMPYVLSPVGAFTGIYGNRNALAYFVLQSAAAAVALSPLTTRGRAAKWAAVAILSITLVTTRSVTSIAALVGLLLIVLVVAFARRRAVLITMGAVVVAAAAVALLNLGRILEVLGKGDTINGRVPIWEALLPVIAQRPVQGYGWMLAWPRGSQASEAVSKALDGVVLFHAHNEVINWLVTTGVIGALLVIALYVVLIATGVRLLLRGNSAGLWILTGGAALVLRGLTEISETSPQGWFVLSILAAAMALALADDPKPFWKRLALPLPLPERPTAHD